MTRFTHLFACATALLTLSLATAQDNAAKKASAISVALDPDFGKNGFVADHVDPQAGSSDHGRVVVIDAEGHPLLAGSSMSHRFAVARYTSAGQPDLTFGTGGKSIVCLEDDATLEKAGAAEIQFTHAAALDAKGRLIVVGKAKGSDENRATDFAVLRFTPDGQPDKSFAGVGFRKFQAHDAPNLALAVAPAADGSIVVAGYALISTRGPVVDPLLIRFTEAGQVDENFSATANGSLRWLAKENIPATAAGVVIDKQGRYLVSLNRELNRRSTWGVARLKSDGEIDASFGDQGLWSAPLDPQAVDELAHSLVLDDSSRIVLGGYSDASGRRRFAVARLTDSGQLDKTFGPMGEGHVILADYGTTVANAYDITYRYGPHAAVFKDRIAITGAIFGPGGNTRRIGLAVMDDGGKNVTQIEPRGVPASNGTDQPWSIAFDPLGRILVGGCSQHLSGKWRFTVVRFVIK
jgi:uncharacterized delta-60 repeat protein